MFSSLSNKYFLAYCLQMISSRPISYMNATLRFFLSRIISTKWTSVQRCVYHAGMYNTQFANAIFNNIMFHQRQFVQQCLLVCPKYANLRKQYLTNYYCWWPSVEKFENLMSSKSQKNSMSDSSSIITDYLSNIVTLFLCF